MEFIPGRTVNSQTARRAPGQALRAQVSMRARSEATRTSSLSYVGASRLDPAGRPNTWPASLPRPYWCLVAPLLSSSSASSDASPPCSPGPPSTGAHAHFTKVHMMVRNFAGEYGVVSSGSWHWRQPLGGSRNDGRDRGSAAVSSLDCCWGHRGPSQECVPPGRGLHRRRPPAVDHDGLDEPAVSC